MVIPKQVSASGFVQLCYKFGLTDSYIPLILPGIAAPVVFFYMKQYMASVLPMEIVDAARVDGSGEFYTFNRIVLPMIKPAIAVQMIFSFVESWNNYFLPALLLNKNEMKTVPIMIAQLRAADYSKFDLGKVYMFILLAILPVLAVYIFLSPLSSRASPWLCEGLIQQKHPAFLFRNAGCLNYTGSPRYSESLSRQFSPSV